MRKLTFLLLSLLLVFSGSIVLAEEADKTEAAELRQQIEQLQKQIDDLKAKIDGIESKTNDQTKQVEATKTSVEKLKRVSLGGYMQLRYNWFSGKEDGGAYSDTFQVKRARFKLEAKPTERSTAIIQLDAADNEAAVKNAYAKYELGQRSEFAIGQMDWPFGFEVPYSSEKRETPERALVFRRLFPGQKDRGATVENEFCGGGKWTLGLFDGTGVDEVNDEIIDDDDDVIGEIPSPVSKDENNHKDVLARVEWDRGSTQFGVSGYFGEGVWDKDRVNINNVPKNRYGADFRYFANKWTFKTEYVKGRGVDEASKKFDQSDWVSGYYVQLDYNTNLPTKDALVTRYSVMSSDPTELKLGRRSKWELGWLRWVDNKTRVRLFYEANKESGEHVDNNGYIAEWMVVY